MIIPDSKSVRTLCREIRGAVAVPIEISEDRFYQVVRQNLASGRFERYAKHRARPQPVSLDDYARVVYSYLAGESPRITALEALDPAVWQHLSDLLTSRAQTLIRQFQPNAAAYVQAKDFAHDACLVIFEQRYPFDIAFEAWATVILRHLIIARYSRSRDAGDRVQHVESLDAPRWSEDGIASPLSELLGDIGSAAPFERLEHRELLLQAIHRLPRLAQQQVIEYSFFLELDDAEIAKRMGKTCQAVYNLRSRALARLYTILTTPETKAPPRKPH